MDIFVLSGKRGGYGALRPFLNRLQKSNLVKLRLALTDQHLSQSFGYTVEEVKKDFENLTLLSLGEYGSEPYQRCEAMVKLQELLIENFTKSKPDLIVLYGDRAESLVCAFVANMFSIKIVHFQGGDKSGSVDEHFRHAITKLSHIHMVSSDDSKKRVLQLGESINDVEVIGDSHIDEIIENVMLTNIEMREKLKIRKDLRIITLLQHSETTQINNSNKQINETLKALNKFKEKYKNYEIVAIYPCSDPGYKEIIDALNNSSFISNAYKNLDAKIFRSLLKNSDIFIGNSSAGIIESPYLGTPSINIGRRQNNRLISSMTFNVPHDSEKIYETMEYIITHKIYLNKKLYGDGKSDLKAFKFLLERYKKVSFAKIFNDI